MNHVPTILYAEDDLDDLLMMKEAFQSYEQVCLQHAANGLDACRALKTMVADGQPPCLIIMDINMPVMNGKEAVRKIRADASASAIPIILFTTSSGEPDLKFAKEFGLELFPKPLHYEDLRKLVQLFVQRCIGQEPSMVNRRS